MTALLEVTDLEVRHGDLRAVQGVSLRVAEGDVLAVIGANGAGKSTLLSAITGLLRPSAGHVRLAGDDVTRVRPHKRVRMGISMVPEGRRLFGSLTVEENLQVGASAKRPGPWDLRSVYELFPLVAERRARRAGAMSGGEQQATAIGRALMSNPRLLLLDEVSLGLAPVVVKQLYAALPAITGKGTTVLLVEQDVRQAFAVADHVHCMLEGRTSLEGTSSGVSMEQVSAAYFGVRA
ncbi:ABC transporter ATP-binding protein [Aquipuribacter sp. MA13-6]|uniref:ABC transporter ATP-binding protein n=1 Tax=unclassified Aquipuribacter TaxID=2635084 RepID=UPI003EE9704F